MLEEVFFLNNFIQNPFFGQFLIILNKEEITDLDLYLSKVIL